MVSESPDHVAQQLISRAVAALVVDRPEAAIDLCVRAYELLAVPSRAVE